MVNFFHKKIKLENLAKFFNTTRQTIARWKTEDNKLALVLTHKYLDDRKINEFITTGKIEKFEEMNNKYEVINPNIENVILNDVHKEFHMSQKNLWIKEIFKTFAIETQYKPLYIKMSDFLKNSDKEKENFYDNFTLFLHKNRAKFYSKDRMEAEMLMCKIFEKSDIYLYYYFNHISNLMR